MSQVLQIAVIALATVGTGAATMSVMKPEMADFPVPEGAWTEGHELDGRSFDVVARDLDGDVDHYDTLIFQNGTFQSVNCEEYCAFGWTDYQTKVIDGVIHFTATPVCSQNKRISSIVLLLLLSLLWLSMSILLVWLLLLLVLVVSVLLLPWWLV